MTQAFTPEFTRLMDQYAAAASSLGHLHPATRRLWTLTLAAAPGWFLDEVRALLAECGLSLDPTAPASDEQTAALAGVAAQLDMTTEELAAAWADIRPDYSPAALPASPANLDTPHRIH